MKKNLLILIAALFCTGSLVAQSPLNFTFRSNLPYPGKSLANIWGYVDNSGNEYALVGTTAGVSIVNVTNPSSPFEAFTVAGTSSQWREIKTWSHYAYVTTEGCCLGLQIIDLGNLPASVNSKYYTGDGAINGQLQKAHALHVDNGYCYLYGSNLFSGAAVILNLADPWNPVYAGNTFVSGLNNYVHDGFVSHDTLWGAHIYGGFFSVFNVANKAAPVLLQTQTTPGAFTHNTWLSDNHRVLFTTDEVSDSYLSAYDVSDINNISLLDKIQSTPGNGSIVHNTYIKNDYAVTSYYTEGVIVVDAARPDNLIKVGHYDTSPAYTSGFHGCWGVYPYLPSGNVICSDIENGLYVLTPNYVRGCYLEGTVTDTITGAPISGATMQVMSTSMFENTNLAGQFKTGTANAGTYTVQVSKSGYDTKTITGVVLNNGVLTTLNVQLGLTRVNVFGNVIEAVTSTVLANANVLLESNNGFTYSTITDNSGYFQVNKVYPGTYTVTAGLWKYHSACQSVIISNPTPSINFTLAKGLYDDFTFDFGWTKSSTAKKGLWVRAIPIGTTYINPGDANPGSDATTDCSKWCYVTGNGGGSYNNDDVDSGYTKLISPALNLKSYSDPVINIRRWFFAQPGSNDTLLIEIKKGAVKYTLEKVSASSPGNSTWLSRSYRVLNYAPLGGSMKLSFYLKDKKPEHAIEAGVDEFSVTENPPPPAQQVVTTISQAQNFIQSVYPNPFSNELSVILSNDEINKLDIELADITGRIILKKSFTTENGSLQIPVSESMVNGIYFLKIHSADQSAVVKLLKN